MKKILLISVLFLQLTTMAFAQQYLGFQGMIHVPTADMDTVGVARVGAHFIPKQMMPDKMLLDGEKFNSLTNYLSITPFRWIELGYGYTLWKFHRAKNPANETGFFAKDRYFSVKLQIINEDKWWPSVAVGGNDVWGSSDKGESASNFYRNYFAALSKHIDLGGNLLGGHIVYRKWSRDFNHKWDGVIGGITFQPSFYTPLRVMGEWDGNGLNLGVDCRLFKYFLVQCSLMELKSFSGGLCLYIPLL
jgi:hypothetical protein